MPQNATEKRIVPAVYFEMFLLRMFGKTYDEIAKHTGYSADHVRRLFSKGHAIYDLWQEWLKTAKEISIEEAKMLMFANLPDIIKARIEHAKSSIMGANEAAKMILNYTLGENSKPENQSNPVERIEGFNYIVPNDPNNNPNMEAAPSVPSTTGRND